jgi:hypothetical protein
MVSRSREIALNQSAAMGFPTAFEKRPQFFNRTTETLQTALVLGYLMIISFGEAATNARMAGFELDVA